MITQQNERVYCGISHYYGLSTDTKPTAAQGAVNGSDFFEIDTGTTYHFNGETGLWVEQTTKYLKSISVAGATTSYTVGESFDTSGITVTATYTDNSTGVVSSDITVEPSGELALSDTYVMVNYTENGIVKSQKISITVSRISLSVPVQNNAPTYDGTEKTATFTNYDATKMTVAGNKATNAGTYTATFTIIDTDTYQWSDTTLTPKNVNWTISKASSSITLSDDTATLSAETPTAEIEVSSTSSGAISVVSSDDSVATAEVEDGVITITRVAEGTASITVSGAADNNHNAPSNKTISVTVSD